MAEKEYIEREAALRDWPLCDEPADAFQYIRSYPAAAARPVVMCMDCKHYKGVHNCKGHAPCDYWGIGGVLWNDFCSRGVKMEES